MHAPAFAGTNIKVVSQLGKPRILVFCHSGLDPESIAFPKYYITGCRIKSGMTGTNYTLF
jgi:hypothetical protein